MRREVSEILDRSTSETMTWCFGKVCRDAVVLFADAAISSQSLLRATESSFGEAHIDGSISNPTVQEGRLKLFRVGPFAVTFAGDVSAGASLIDALHELIDDNCGTDHVIHEAAKRAAFPKHAKARILIASHFGEPKLALIDSSDATKVVEVTDSIHLGSIPSQFTSLTEGMLRSIPQPEAGLQQWVTQPLSLMQSYGLHHGLMEEGVGGAFACCWIDKHGFHWQPDMLFVVHDDDIAHRDLAGVLFREDVMNVLTSMGGANRIFINRRTNESLEIAYQRSLRAYVSATADFDAAKFDFVSFLNFEQHILTVVEMQRQLRHRLLVLEPVADAAGTIGIYWSPELLKLVREIPNEGRVGPLHDVCIRWLPFRSLLEE